MSGAHRYGPWALITGASDGIGRALAVRVAAEGINVVLAARSADVLDALAAELTAAHGIETRVLPESSMSGWWSLPPGSAPLAPSSRRHLPTNCS